MLSYLLPHCFLNCLATNLQKERGKKNAFFLFHVMHQMHLWCNPSISQLNTQGAFGPC